MVTWPLPTGEDLVVTIDNFKKLHDETEDAIESLQERKISFRSTIDQLFNNYQTQLETKHLKDVIANRPATAQSGTIFIIKS